MHDPAPAVIIPAVTACSPGAGCRCAPPIERGGASGVLLRCFLLLLRVSLGGMFIFAASVKLSGPLDFSDSIKAFKILPDHLAQLATFAVPWIEMVCAVALILGVWSRAAAAVISALLLVFIAGIASVMWRGLNVHCGCFGKLQPFCTGPLGACNIIQNAILCLAGMMVAAGGGGYLALDRVLNGCRCGRPRPASPLSAPATAGSL